jgi:antitoxin CptB
VILVVRIVEAARVGPLAGRLHFDEADEGIADGRGEIRTRLQVSKSCLANELNSAAQAADLSQILHERFKRSAQLIFWRTAYGRVRQLRFCTRTEIRNGACDRFPRQLLFPRAHAGWSALGRAIIFIGNLPSGMGHGRPAVRRRRKATRIRTTAGGHAARAWFSLAILLSSHPILWHTADIARPPRYMTLARPRPGTRRWAMTGSSKSSDGLDHRRRKLLFRSWHRGIREMDLIMGRFADALIDRLSDAELAEYERLIQVPDPDLYAWISGEIAVPANYDTPLLRRLRDFHFNSGHTT